MQSVECARIAGALARWRAVALMMPSLQGQIDVGEFVYDRHVPTLRATIYGLKS